MATTLSYGFVKPATGDNGTIWFPALEADIQQLNDHNHDGSNSAKLTAQSIVGVSQTITSAGWSGVGGGRYRQLVTVPASITFDDYKRAFVINSGALLGYEVNPTVVKVTNTTFYVYTNNNTQDLKILYLV